jgi:alginate O-acetyltransferase complex protein AlgI
MLFSSLTFIFFFLPLVFLLHWALKKEFRNIFLLISSLIFFFWGEQKQFWVFILSIFLNYLIVKLIVYLKDSKLKKALLVFGIILDVGFLAVFKYLNFFTTNLNQLNSSVTPTNLILPVGISFFIFHEISLLVDIYKSEKDNQKPDVSLVNTFLYISLFPQLIAGPIVKYREIIDQLKDRVFSSKDLRYGIERFIVGLSKKVLIADQIGLSVNQIFDKDLANWTNSEAVIFALGYSLQIYFDFSGYSDMAIGLGKMFGFTFIENFNYPYVSKSIGEFWRRWNISLGSWFREYIYIPLGGNRVSKLKGVRNLAIIFLITGIWHGASWTFIIWGIWHGFWAIAERLGLSVLLKKTPAIIQIFYTLVIVQIGWVFFRSSNPKQALKILYKIFQFILKPEFKFNLSSDTIIIFIFAIIFAFPWWQVLAQKLEFLKKYKWHKYLTLSNNFIKGFSLLTLFLFTLIFIISTTQNAFIYFQF